MSVVAPTVAWAAPAGQSRDASASGSLTEREAIERALANEGLDDRLTGHVDAAEAHRKDVGRWPNPSVTYTREQLLGAAPTGTDFLVFSQAFDISGHRYLERKAASTRIDAARLENEASRADVVARTRTAYAEALYAQELLGLLEQWRDGVGRVVQAARARASAGDISRFDAARSSQELRVLEARIAHARGMRLRAWAGLRAVMDGESPPDPPQLVGPLLPAPGHEPGGVENSPRLRAVETELSAVEQQRRAARRAWVPPLRINLGYKGERTSGSPREHGFTAGASIALPLGSRGQQERQRAQADTARLRGETYLLRRELLSREDELRARLDALGAGLSQSPDGDLPTLARSAYESGEIGITQTLDTYRGSFEAESAALELALEIRLARIELDRLAGRTTP